MEDDHNEFRRDIALGRERLARIETKLDANTQEHAEIKQDQTRIFEAITSLTVAVQSEQARRGVLVAIGGAVVAAFGAVVWALFGSDAYAAVHAALHRTGAP